MVERHPRKMGELPYDKILKILAVVWLALGVVVAAVVVLRPLTNLLMMVFLAVVFSLALNQPAGWLTRRFPRMPWMLAVAIVYFGLFLLMVIALAILGVPLLHQVQALIKSYPEIVDYLKGLLPDVQRFLGKFGIDVNLGNLNQRLAELARAYGSDLLNNVLAGVAYVSSAITQLILVFVLSLYLVLQGPEMVESIKRRIPEAYRHEAVALAGEANSVLGGFIRGLLLLSVIMGVVAGLAAVTLGLPYPAVIGLVAAVMEFVPIIGPLIAGAVAVAIALFQGVGKAIAIAIIYLIIQQLESNVLYPRVMGSVINIHPFLAILAFLAGLELFGLWGAIFAAPVTGIAVIVIRYAYRWYEEYTSLGTQATLAEAPPD